MPKVKTPDSSLVKYIWSGNTYNYNVRTHSIDTITPHHMANGTSFNKGYVPSTTLAACDTLNGKKGSVQYLIDSNGDTCQMLNEKYRAWTSNSRSNDHRAVTIEVANDGGAPDWHISDKALQALVNLCVDICRRHGKKKLLWISDPNKAIAYEPKSDEMKITLHKWVAEKPAATNCPEKYMTSKMPYLAESVTKALGGTPTPAPEPAFTPYIIRVTYKTGLNIRSGPGVNYQIVSTVPYNGYYTIVQEQKNGTQTWGRLKSGAGWICLTGFTEVYKK